MDEVTDNLGNAEQKYLQAINDLDCLLQRVDRSEQEDLAHVGLACDRLQQMVEDFRRNLKEMRQSSHSQVRKSLNDVKSAHSQGLAIVTSHRGICSRASTVACSGLIHVTQALTERVNSLDLSIEEKGSISPTSSTVAPFCEDQVGQIEKILRKEKMDSKVIFFYFIKKNYEYSGKDFIYIMCVFVNLPINVYFIFKMVINTLQVFL